MGLKFNVAFSFIMIGLGLTIPRVMVVLVKMDLLKAKSSMAPLNAEDCSVITKDVEGSKLASPSFEDIVYVRLHNDEVSALSCTGDLWTLWHTKNGSQNSEQNYPAGGACYLFDPQDPSKLTVIPFEGFPSETVGFHAHGLYYAGFNEINQNEDLTAEFLKKQQQDRGHHQDSSSSSVKTYPLLFIVNHAYLKGGERVEAFELRDPHGHGYVLTYRGSIGAEHLTPRFNGVLNDLVVDVQRRTMYVTQYLQVSDNIAGRGNGDTWEQKLGSKLFNLYAVTGMLNTILWRCQMPQEFSQLMEPLPKDARVAADPAREKEIPVTHCENVAEGFSMANGIQAVNLPEIQQKIIFVNDLLDHQITVLATGISAEASAGQPDHNPVVKVGTVKLLHALDNIEFSRLVAHHHPIMSFGGANIDGYYNAHQRRGEKQVTDEGWKFGFFGGAISKISEAVKLPHQSQVLDAGGLTFTQVVLAQNGSTPSGLMVSETSTAEVLMHGEGSQGGTASGVVLPTTANIGSINEGTLGGKTTEFWVAMGSWRDNGALVCNVAPRR